MSRLVIAFALFATSLLTSVTAVNAAPTSTGSTVSAVEYYNSQLDHYFLTATPEEIAALNSGQYPGWVSTNLSFPVLPIGTTDRGTVPVCRFYAAAINSHFYSANSTECSEVQHKFPGTWVLESANVFRAYLPDLNSGVCPTGTKPIHRLWNKRSDSNHRYTDNLAVVAAMERQGYVADGYGPAPGTAFCEPTVARVTAQANSMACTVVGSEASPLAGSRITLTANCSGSPTSYIWQGCSSTTNICIAMSGAAASSTYSVAAIDAANNSASASTTINWRTVAAPNVSCSLVASNSAPLAGTSITLTATCAGHQVTYAWTGCTQLPGGNACMATSATAGEKSYSVTASSNGANSVTTTSVNWQAVSPPSTVSCTAASSNSTPTVATNVTLTATCTGSPTSFTWVGCSSSTSTCVATSANAGSSSYAVTASNATNTSSPAIVSVTWQAAPPSGISCTLAASNPTPTVGASVTLTSVCTGNPTNFTWVGCASSTSSCVATSSIVGIKTYSMTAGNSNGTSAPATVNVNWQSASPPPPPPPTGEVGAWTRYSTGPGSVNEATEQTWYNLAWDTQRNRAYGISWLKTLSAFDPAVGAWSVISPTTGRTDFHNRTIAYDPLNDRLWVSDGTGDTGTGGAFQYFDFATNSWVQTPMAAAPSYEATMIYDPAGKRLIAFGGWLLAGVTTFALQPVATSWHYESVPGIAPAYANDFQKMTAWRSMLDSSRNRILHVDTDGSLWALPLSLSGWQHIATTATPPPVTTQFVYDAVNDTIVGWSASPQEVVDDGVTGTTRSTWLLPLSTLAWSQAANVGHGDVVPVSTAYVGYAMAYDPVRGQTLLHTIYGGDEFSPQTWFYRAPAGGSPPPPGVSCSLGTSNANPTIGSSVTLTASCTGGPTAYAWVGCTSSSATCVATSATAGTKSYSVTASNSNSASSPATVSVNWQAGATPVTCGVTTSNTTPVAGTNITLTASCSGSPTSYAWVGCTSSTSTCIATSATAGTRTYSMTASNASSTSSSSAATVNWLAAPPPPPTITGTWVSALLPNMPNTGAAVAPFMYNQVTKHVAMVEVAPGKIAVYGGDYTGAPYADSYRQDSWTLDVATGIWTQRGAYGSPDPRPHRPDTMGIGWDAQNQRVLFVPGIITEGVGEVWSHYPDGHWVKETTNFGGTGMMRGGVYDAQTRRWLAFVQSSSLGTVVREWNVDTWQTIATTVWAGSTSDFTEYVEDSLPTIVGRNVYMVAREVRADSTTSVRFFRWNIDTRTMTRMADPPVPVNTSESTLLGTSGTKVVWPYILGPEGVIAKVLVYDTMTNVWSEDVGRPSLASQNEFLANSVCSMSDGSVFMAGSAFNSTRQTHWFRRLQ